MRERNPRLGGQGGLIEAVASLLAELGLRRVDSTGHTADLGWLALQPAAELERVVETLLVDPWAQKNLGRASQPAHLRKRWQVYLDGPSQPEPAQIDPEVRAARVRALRGARQTAVMGVDFADHEAERESHKRDLAKIDAELRRLGVAS